MTGSTADRLVAAYILEKYREDKDGHLAECPDLAVETADASDSTYGCDTGCEYVRFEAILVCSHGERAEWEWGEFGELASILEDLEGKS